MKDLITVFVVYLPWIEMGIFLLACCAVYEFYNGAKDNG